MTEIARNMAVGAVDYGHAAVQRVLGRDRTAGLGRWIAVMYRDQPLLLGLVLTWAAFVAAPLAAFAGYAALWAAISFLVFWAIFIFWAGLGLLVFLVPAVCIATGLSLVAFAWAAVAYYFAGAWVLQLLGYDSLDAALGVSSAPASVSAPVSVPAMASAPAKTMAPAPAPAPPVVKTSMLADPATLPPSIGHETVGVKRQPVPAARPIVESYKAGGI